MKWLSHPPEGFTGHYIFLSKPSQQHAVRRHIRYSRSQVRYSRHSDKNNQVTCSLTTLSGALKFTSQL